MEMAFRVSDMELMNKAGKLLKYEDYIQIREKYKMRNPKRYVNAETHRRIMQEAVSIAKGTIFRKGADEEIRNACVYLYICTDSRKYRLDWQKARKDLEISELARKCQIDIS